MLDNERVSDAELVAKVAAHDHELAMMVRARLKRLRLASVQSAVAKLEGVAELSRVLTAASRGD